MEITTESVCCPKCKSEYVGRLHRPQWMKSISSKKKFICTDCGKQFYSTHNKLQSESGNETVSPQSICVPEPPKTYTEGNIIRKDKLIWVKELLIDCPFGNALSDCPLIELRNTPVKGRLRVAEQFTENELDEIIDYHKNCFERREKLI